MKFGTSRINQKLMISDHELSRLSGVSKEVIELALKSFKEEDGQGDTVHVSFIYTYADKTAFFELASKLDLDESLSQSVLEALGEFTVPKAVAQ